MGFLIFLAAVGPVCSIHQHGKAIFFPCQNVRVLPREPIETHCRGDRFSKTMSFEAVTGYCLKDRRS